MHDAKRHDATTGGGPQAPDSLGGDDLTGSTGGRLPAVSPDAPARKEKSRWAIIATILALIALIYGGTLNYPFIYDDYDTIVKNGDIKDLAHWWLIPFKNGTRPLLFVTFAINFAIEGLGTRYGYHLVNIAIHAVVSLLLLWVTPLLWRATQKARGLAESADSTAFGQTIATAAAVLYAVHPLQTESVTYISSRSDSLSALFFIATIGVFLRTRLSPGSHPWLGRLAVYGLTLAALLTKEVAATLPVALVALDLLLFEAAPVPAPLTAAATKPGRKANPAPAMSASPARGIAWAYHAPLLAILAVGAIYKLIRLERESAESPLPRGMYVNLLTQAEVVWRYVSLWLWPAEQSIVHDFPVIDSAWFDIAPVAWIAVLLWFFALPSLFSLQPFVALAVGWYFLTLAPSSSLLPLQETMSEHRTYLANVGLAWLSGYLLARIRYWRPVWFQFWVGRLELKSTLLALTVVPVLTWGAAVRNEFWSDPILTWLDCLKKSPTYHGAHYSLADAYRDHADRLTENARELEEQRAELEKDRNQAALDRLDAQMAPLVEKANEFYRAAAHHYQETIALLGFWPDARINAGLCFVQVGDYDAAEYEWKRGLQEVDTVIGQQQFGHLGLPLMRTKFRTNLGRLYMLKDDLPAAEAVYDVLLKDEPGNFLVHLNAAELYERQGRAGDALRETLFAIQTLPEWDRRRESLKALAEVRRQRAIPMEGDPPPPSGPAP